jgi:ABC-type transport system involved in cytochrome c biogenesis permease subunit
LALRRGEYGEAIHGLLGPVDELLADLVQRGQDSGVFARHLPAGILSQVAYGVVFAIADGGLSNGTIGARAATITSLLMLGVPETRAIALVGDQP